MARRGRGEGTVARLPDGSWYGRISLGKDENNKYIRKSVYGKSRAEVIRKLIEIRNAVRKGLYIKNSVTVAQWLRRWLVEYKAINLKPHTYDSYEMQIEHNIIPGLGHLLLKEITSLDVQAFYNNKYNNGHGLSSATIRKINSILHAAFNKAIENDIMRKNITNGVQLPRFSQEDVRAFTLDEQKRFFEAAKDYRLYNAFLINVDTGLRAGELLALEWDDIDLEQGLIRIDKGLAVINNRDGSIDTKTVTVVMDSPKTEASIRVIPLTTRSLNLLRETAKVKTCQLVFPSENNTHVGLRNYIRTFHKVLEKAGMEKRGPHVLRHTFVTRCFEINVQPKVISVMVGHAKLSHTMDIYTHVAMNIKRDAVKALDELYM